MLPHSGASRLVLLQARLSAGMLLGLALLAVPLGYGQVEPVWSEDFESQPRGTAAPGQRQELHDGWHNATDDDADWIVHSGPTPVVMTGPAIDVEPGSESGKYIFVLGWNQQGSEAILTGPLLDTAGLVDPTLEFYLHQHGGSMGTLYVEIERELSAGSTGEASAAGNVFDAPGAGFGPADVGGQLWIEGSQEGNDGRYTITAVISSSEVELDGPLADEAGLTWSHSDVSAPLASHTGNQDAWLLRSHSVAAAVQTGTGRFRPRFRGVTGSSHFSDMALDAVSLVDRGLDLGLEALLEPHHGYALGTETVTVELANHGTQPVSNVDLHLLVNDQLLATETYTQTLPAGDTDTFTFTSGANLSSVGIHTVRVQHFLPDDANPANDSVERRVRHAEQVTSLPFEEDFAGPTSNVLTSGDWQRGSLPAWTGTPQESGVATDLGEAQALGETMALYSPVFDLRGTSNPVLAFGHRYSLARLDRHYVEVSLDGGRTFSRLGTVGQGTNWYNDPLIQGFAGEAGWRTATFPLTAFVGESEVAFRVVLETSAILTGAGVAIRELVVRERDRDVGVVGFTSPRTGCRLGPETVRVTLHNYGSQSESEIELVLEHNGQEIARETYLGPLGPSATDTFTFTAAADLSALGSHSLRARTDLPGDVIPGNDAHETEVAHLPLVDTWPYDEDFEGGDGHWVAEGSPGSPVSWEHGRPFGQRIASAAVGSRVWVTNRTGPYAPNETSYLHWPCFDMSGLSEDPTLRFRYHSDLEAGYDAVWLEVSTDGGETYAKLGQAGPHWYNDASLDAFSASSDGWQTARLDLSGLAGEQEVRLRFVLQSDSSLEGEGFAVDDVFLGVLTRDVGVEAMTPIAAAPGLSANTPVEVTLRNHGNETVSQIPVELYHQGERLAEEWYEAPLDPGASATFTFTTSVDLSAVGGHTLTARTTLAGDQDPSNDAATLTTRHLARVDAFPYTESFEEDDGHFYAEGTRSSWEHGMPRRTFLGTAGHAQKAWGTNLTGSYHSDKTSYLYTPSFDFSGLSNDPTLRFLHIYELAPGDAHWLEISTDGAESWSKLGSYGEGVNWYDDDALQAWTGTSGASRQWQRAELELTSLAGEADVRLRFVLRSESGFTLSGVGLDAVSLAVGDEDLAVESISEIPSDVALDQETVEVTLRNHGTTPQSNVELALYVDDMHIATETYTGPLAVGGSDTFTFSAPADLSAEGRHVVRARTVLASDVFPFNDTAELVVWHQPTITNYPYLETFQQDEGGWVVGGTDPSWELGSPDKAVIRGAFHGERAWVTGGVRFGTVHPSEDSYIRGPRFDLSNLADPEISLAVWWECEIGHDGAAVQVSTDGGTTWQTLGSSGAAPPAANWYTFEHISAEPGGHGAGFSGTVADGHGSGDWLIARHRLVDDSGASLAGESDVRVRVAFASRAAYLHDGVAFDRVVVRDRVPSLHLEQPHLTRPPEAFPTVAAPQSGWPVQTLRLEAVASAQVVEELSLTIAGELSPEAVDAVRLWRDTSEPAGRFDPQHAQLLQTASPSANGRVTFDNPAIGLAADQSATLHLTLDLAAGADAGEFHLELRGAHDVQLAGSDPVTALGFPLQGSRFLLFRRGKPPFATDFSEVPANLLAHDAAGERYPMRLDGGLEIGLEQPTPAPARLRRGTSYDGLHPVEGDHLAVIDFPDGPATGALDVHLDFAGRSVERYRAPLVLRWAQLGEPDPASTNVYLSLDGGATWRILVDGLASTGLTGHWQTTSLDLAQPLIAAGYERFPENAVLRVQASGTPGDALLLDKLSLELQAVDRTTVDSGGCTTGNRSPAWWLLLATLLLYVLARRR